MSAIATLKLSEPGITIARMPASCDFFDCCMAKEPNATEPRREIAKARAENRADIRRIRTNCGLSVAAATSQREESLADLIPARTVAVPARGRLVPDAHL